jgi:nucleoside-diphosphate-sugar epimerase
VPVSALVLTGASSFLGRALLAALPAGLFSELRLLIHHQLPEQLPAGSRVMSIAADLLKPDTLRELVAPGSTVIHLAYLAPPHRDEENVSAAHNLIAACRDARIRRLVHCSTAVVAGNVPDDVITEETACHPRTEYERVKYRIEQEMRDAAAGRYEITILRPTLVFGPGGRNLAALAERIWSGNSVINFAYSALQSRRRMNLVSVRNVVAALRFLAAAERRVDRQTYIISDDHEPSNNFHDVERILGHEFGRERGWRAAMPPIVLAAALKAKGRSNSNPGRIYSDDKLKGAGFAKPWPFGAALAEYARWFRMQRELQAPVR